MAIMVNVAYIDIVASKKEFRNFNFFYNDLLLSQSAGAEHRFCIS